MIWLALNVVVTGLLAFVAASVIMLLFKALKLRSFRAIGPVATWVLTIMALFGLLKLVMQFTHVAPAAGSIHLALGFLVAFVVAPASFAWLNQRDLANA